MTDPCVRNDVYLQKRYIRHVCVRGGSTASKLANKVSKSTGDRSTCRRSRLGMSMQMAIQ
ncbi:hypothetical protein CGCVW01_v006374 [Colletotrichum viniferum]|nr:hypothetical protein CGCVW01_v006374 [Colletotrichum viniferum]